mmetsp:Transcript_77199/g.136741  ORF Transcript_77199/g.136741 Transcript_77199/m.136741 type:complete len:353 (-) Transcript_77199:135-1193(-)
MLCLKLAIAAFFTGLASLTGWLVRTKFRKPQLDTSDCYFDEECHAKVDWSKVKQMKMRFFAGLKQMKAKEDAKDVQRMMSRMHKGFLNAGMPDDRIDYILTKWVEYVYPGAFDAHDSWKTLVVTGFSCENGYGEDVNGEYIYQGNTKDGRPYYQGSKRPDRFIYYDKYCADDTTEPRWLVGGSPDITQEFNLNTKDGKGCDNDFSIVTDSMHIPGGQQPLAWQWCQDHGYHSNKFISITYKVNSTIPKKDIDKKDCYFDKECHAKVDWSKVKQMKLGFFARLKMMKEKGDTTRVKKMMARMHQGFLKAGMPEDRIDYILTKWVKFVFPEALNPETVDPQFTTSPDAGQLIQV